MNKFENEEMDFWIDTCKRYLNKGDALIEMGMGSGRILDVLARKGFNVYGFDNDRFFISHCKKRKLKVFYADATKIVNRKHKGKYKVVGISFNTLFNFPNSIRLKWAIHACDLLKDEGVLIVTAYSYSNLSMKTIDEKNQILRKCLKTTTKSSCRVL